MELIPVASIPWQTHQRALSNQFVDGISLHAGDDMKAEMSVFVREGLFQ